MVRRRLGALASSALAVAVAAAAAAAVTQAATTGSGHARHCARRSDYTQGSGGVHGRSCARGRAPARRRPGARAGCPGAGLRPAAANIAAVRSAVFCLVNRERAHHGEPPLRPNVRLRHAAQQHSESMGLGGYFAHAGPGGGSPLSRMRAVGYISNSVRGYQVGENIGWGTLWLSTPRSIVAAWMASPGHRANILDRRFRDTAVGVCAYVPGSFAHGQRGAIYTEDFGVVHGR